MVTQEEVYNVLKEELLRSFRRLKEEDIFPDVYVFQELQLDSLDITDVLCFIEDYYNVELVQTEEEKKEFHEAIHKEITFKELTEYFTFIINRGKQ